MSAMFWIGVATFIAGMVMLFLAHRLAQSAVDEADRCLAMLDEVKRLRGDA